MRTCIKIESEAEWRRYINCDCNEPGIHTNEMMCGLICDMICGGLMMCSAE